MTARHIIIEDIAFLDNRDSNTYLPRLLCWHKVTVTQSDGTERTIHCGYALDSQKRCTNPSHSHLHNQAEGDMPGEDTLAKLIQWQRLYIESLNNRIDQARERVFKSLDTMDTLNRLKLELSRAELELIDLLRQMSKVTREDSERRMRVAALRNARRR